MLNRQSLLHDLQRLLARIEADLLERSESADVPDVGQRLHAEYERAKGADRTAQNFEDWRSDAVTQHAAAWLLSCVFVRFLEDNRLIEPARIAGPADRLQRARDEHEFYFRSHPRETDREYLLSILDELAGVPGTKDLFGEHNPIHELPNWLSGDAATELLRFFQKIDADSGLLVHDFTDPNWDTRFLGDLYQDLSEAARKKYALLQTPEFVEEFILDRTLEPALDEFWGGGLGSSALDFRKGKDAPSDSSLKSKAQDPKPLPFKMIDPACGSGHFLLGAFPRLLARWRKREPGTNLRDLVQRALDSIHGVDINPYAVAIARFRLLLAAMRASGVTRLADAPAFDLNLVCGDSLLHAPLRHGGDTSVIPLFEMHDVPECSHAYAAEDLPLLKRILAEGQYHAVVANPPYITPKDRALNQAYRDRYETCHMKYSLAVPFLERIYRLAVDGGYTGQITANSFMKREFGKKLIEQFLPKIDLTHVIDTSGAYIPGHGTPTVLLFGRRRPPVANTIRTVMGIRGEPSTPDEPAHGLVWSAIVAQVDQPGSQSEFVSVADSSRELLGNHPWSIGGGGAAELKEQLEESTTITLSTVAEAGIAVVTLEDDAYQVDSATARRSGIPRQFFRGFVIGDTVRDWQLCGVEPAIFPHDGESFEPVEEPTVLRRLWPLRTGLVNRLWFRKTMPERHMKWFAYGHISIEKFRTPLSIVYGEVATHNHFVLDRGGKVFKQTAPVIKLPADATEDAHLALLGLLNSSTACFWLKQCAHNKGDSTDDKGARTTGDSAFNTYAYNATLVGKLPLPECRLLERGRSLDELARRLAANSPRSAIEHWQSSDTSSQENLRQALNDFHIASVQIRDEMILMQEDLDWQCYRLYGLIDADIVVGIPSHSEPRSIPPGTRAFEILLARDLAAGKTQSTWFERHGITPHSELPADLPPKYRVVAERRIEIIESNPQIALIEQPEYKRRWNTEQWESQQERALREWLLGRLESYFDFDGRMRPESSSREGTGSGGQASPITLNFGGPDIVISFDAPPPLADIRLVSVSRLADVARQDAEFLQVGEVYRDDAAFDVQKLVAELVESESVPLLPVLRYKATGLRKRAEWEQTWELQREEDREGLRLSALDFREEDASESSLKSKAKDLKPSSIPVPPKYTSADFLKSDYWRLRGKLDVPKERWVSFPHCEGPDGTLVIAWAGYNHLQLARAISEYYVEVQERHGGRDDPRLIPLLAGLIELLPWLRQWHNDPDPAFDNMRMGDYFESFVNEEARQLGKTIPEIKAWEPPARTGRRRRG